MMFEDNQMFSAGAGLIGMATGIAMLRFGGKSAVMMVRRKYLTTLEIPSHDKSFDWFMRWMTEQAATDTRHLSVRTSFFQHDNGSVSTHFTFVPGKGYHYFKYSGTWFQLERQQDKGSDSSVETGVLQSKPRETVTLTAVTRNLTLIEELLQNCKEHALKDQEGKLMIYTAVGHEWRPFGGPRRRRSLDSVILKEGVSESIYSDVTEFLDTKRGGAWYISKGIPYRRGYLLHGSPGSGKSSFIYSLASQLEYNIAVVNLAEKWMSDDRLGMLFANVPARCIILLEDVDAAFASTRQGQSDNNLTFSGLLNALDGVTSAQEGRLIFMTTNHIDRLDPALMRPGRVDKRVMVGDASLQQVRRMFERFYGTSDVDQFLDKVTSKREVPADQNEPIEGLSMAYIQGHFVMHKDDPKSAISSFK